MIRSAAGARSRSAALRHPATVCVAFSLYFLWVFAHPIVQKTYLSDTDLFDYYLPSFLSPPLIWSTFEYAGTPVIADPEGSLYYPARRLFAHLAGSWTGFIVFGYVLGACALYAYVYEHTRSKAAAALAGLTFTSSEAMLERLPHPTIVHAIAWVPLVLLAVDRVAHRERRWLWAAAGGFAAGNCLLSGHPQLPLYAGYLCAAYAACVVVRQRFDRRTIAAIAIIGVSGLLMSAVSLWPLVAISSEVERQTVRFVDFVSYANTLPQMLSVAFPRIAHPGLESPTYVGMVALLLAPLGVAQFRTNWRAAFWAVVVVLALVLGTGAVTPLASLVHDLPFYERFRIVSRHLVFAAMGSAVLAGFALAALSRGGVRLRALLLSSIPALAVLAGGALAILRTPQRVPLDPAAHLSLFGDATGVATQIALTGTALGACVLFWRARRSVAAIALLLVIAGADLLHAVPWPISITGVEFETLPQEAMVPSVHVERLRTMLAPLQQRLLTPGGARGNDVVAGPRARLWQIPIAGGYSSVQLRHISQLLPRAGSHRFNTGNLERHNVVLDLLAVRYVLVAAGAEDEPLLQEDPARWREVERFSTSLVSDRERDESVPGETEYVVYENLRAQPRAWMTGGLLAVSDGTLEDAVHGAPLRDGQRFDVASIALVDQGGVAAREYDPGRRTAAVESIDDGLIRVRTSSDAGGFLVLSEAYDHGWQARIDDGVPRPVIRTNLALQGVDVPAGDHLVTFEFVPRSRSVGLALSMGGIATILGCCVAGMRRR